MSGVSIGTAAGGEPILLPDAALDTTLHSRETTARAVIGAVPSGMEAVVSGGDDYEVLCAIPENRWADFQEASQRAGVPVTAIGRITAGEGAPRFLDAQGRAIALKRLSYSHF